MRSPGATLALSMGILCITGVAALASEVEDALERAWRGAWVLTQVEAYSDCAGFYNNNEVFGTRVVSKADRRFAPGELARVDKINLKTSRIDFFLTLGEPILSPRQDGPFTLFDEKECRIQLLIDLPESVVRAGSRTAVDAAVAAVLEQYPSREEAVESQAWNGRVRDPYPEDYQETLALHAAWKVEQHNAAMAAVQADAEAIIDAISERIDSEPPYADGFAAGIAALRSWRAPGCSALASASFTAAEHRPAKEHRGDTADQRAWRRGFRDGQQLVFALRTFREARECFLPPPPP